MLSCISDVFIPYRSKNPVLHVPPHLDTHLSGIRQKKRARESDTEFEEDRDKTDEEVHVLVRWCKTSQHLNYTKKKLNLVEFSGIYLLLITL